MIREARLRRRPIRPAVRAAVVARDGMRCRYCSREVRRRLPDEPYSPDLLHLDHVLPWAMGGPDDVDNLVVACAGCNLTRPQPRRGSAAENRLLWEFEDGAYYWRDPKYRPPGALRTGYDMPDMLFDLDEAAEILSCSVVDILVFITRGTLRGTTGVSRPIRLMFWPYFTDYVEKRMDELGWEA